jgi:hypothetical protein
MMLFHLGILLDYEYGNNIYRKLSRKKWIKPIVYTITGLVRYSIINNKVHWAGDYPMAIALVYLCTKQVSKRNRKVIKNATTFTKQKGILNYIFNYVNGKMMPRLVYTF